MRDLGEVGSYEEYLALWKEEYPSEYKWYELVVAEGDDYRVVSVEECAVINARLDWGYYFAVKGKAWNRAVESVRFYLALKEAGLPVVLEDAEEIITRFEGTDYVGIVPHSVIPAYCGGMFPPEYGPVIDFMHVYSDEIGQLEGLITWLPERQAELIQGQRNGETLES
ncbi:MAG: hypothetical protein IKD70_07030 [Eggerthellaceae bacterium]|nr:hypothetical protein [Eggerthellaceae bacterium]